MKGLWDNYPVEVIGVIYTVTKCVAPPASWQNNKVGTKRQGLKIRQKGYEFLIDNEHGDGYLKVTEGRGSFMYGHKSVVDPISVQEIPDDQIKTVYDQKSLETESYEHDKWVAEHFPDLFKKLLLLRDGIKKLREESKEDKKEG